MTGRDDSFENVLAERYASRAMVRIFSPRHRFTVWRRLWLALAECQAELGLDIGEEALAELRAHVEDADLARAADLERELRHDVMAHVHAWREQCPKGGAVLHLGATSCFITDNSELVQMREGLELLEAKLVAVLRRLRAFCLEHADRPALGWTHFQPAQLTTVGKRASLWLQDLLMDHQEVSRELVELRFRGVKGTTGTQDSFLKLFGGDADRVLRLDDMVARRMGFTRVFPVTGQTYTRKQDARVLNVLAGIAQSAGKLSSDLRLLAHLQEVEEPFGSRQVGSSAMAYKRNPMRSERMAALSRWLVTIVQNAPLTAAAQWLERSLDDSANRRLTIPQAFLTADALLELLLNVTGGLVVQEAVIARRVQEHLPFVASEEILMEAVRAGGDRQELHEVIRRASLEAAERMKRGEGPNDVLERLRAHPALGPAVEAVAPRLSPERFTGLAASQVRAFIAAEVDPVLADRPGEEPEDEVRV